MNRVEWLDWKTQSVTKAFYEACNERIEDAKELLALSAGIDPDQDNMIRGIIKAYREMIEFEVYDD